MDGTLPLFRKRKYRNPREKTNAFPGNKGENGFGYDPLFYYPEFKKTFAQMSQDEKNSVSHRGKAMKELISEIDKVLIWLKQRMDEE